MDVYICVSKIVQNSFSMVLSQSHGFSDVLIYIAEQEEKILGTACISDHCTLPAVVRPEEHGKTHRKTKHHRLVPRAILQSPARSFKNSRITNPLHYIAMECYG